jgi:hypothetical protein
LAIKAPFSLYAIRLYRASAVIGKVLAPFVRKRTFLFTNEFGREGIFLFFILKISIV